MPNIRRRVRFVKMNAGGNDFVVLDNRDKRLPQELSELAERVCRRKFNIGADGILVLENSRAHSFRMIYYNADGSRASMCGNGARCMAYFAYHKGAAPADMTFDTDAGFYRAQILQGSVKLFMRAPREVRGELAVRKSGKKISMYSIDIGVPHVVLFVRNIETADVDRSGRFIRGHNLFKPEGTNVNFVKKKNSRSLWVRTYERGVEGETSACGTGVTASALTAGIKGMVKFPVRCITRGGGILSVDAEIDTQDGRQVFRSICLEGPVQISFTGEVFV